MNKFDKYSNLIIKNFDFLIIDYGFCYSSQCFNQEFGHGIFIFERKERIFKITIDFYLTSFMFFTIIAGEENAISITWITKYFASIDKNIKFNDEILIEKNRLNIHSIIEKYALQLSLIKDHVLGRDMTWWDDVKRYVEKESKKDLGLI